MTDIEILDDVAYSGRSRATYKLNAGGTGEKPKAFPTVPVQLSPDSTQSIVASWGPDNLRPQKILKALEGLPQAKEILNWKARSLYSGGIVYGIEDAEGNFKRIKDPAVEQFFRDTNIKRYLIEACVDYYWFGNPFHELIINGGRQCSSIVVQDAMFCRLGIQNPKTGTIDKAYINANWDNNATISAKDGIPVIDPYYGRFDRVKVGKEYKYIYVANFPSPGKVYYQSMAWHDLVESGWLDVAKAIPAFKKALFKNQMTIKYHIEIAVWYWEWKYEGQWTKFTPAEKRTAIKETLEEIDVVLAGEGNAGKSIHSWKKIGEDGKEISAVTIHPLDDKLKSGIYIEDSQEAFSNIMFSMGTDPTLVGNAPGKNQGAGSGSDKRVAFNIYMLTCKADQDIILEPLEYVRDLNGWNPEIKFMFNNYYIATLDQGKEVTSTGSANGGGGSK